MSADQNVLNRPVVAGNVYVSARSRTGRQWRVTTHVDSGVWRLAPQGGDVSSARSERTGKWQGGVRAIKVPTEHLRDPRRWTQVA